MFKLYDRVLDKKTGEPCFIIDIDFGRDPLNPEPVYCLEFEDYEKHDLAITLAEENEIEKLPRIKLEYIYLYSIDSV